MLIVPWPRLLNPYRALGGQELKPNCVGGLGGEAVNQAATQGLQVMATNRNSKKSERTQGEWVCNARNNFRLRMGDGLVTQRTHETLPWKVRESRATVFF